MATSYEMPFPNKLKDAREEAGLTQQQLAEAIGVTVQALQNYEYGKRDIKASRLKAISDALGCSMMKVMGMDTAPWYVRAVPSSGHARPVVGRIAAGTPSEAIANSDEWHPISDDLYVDHPDGFWLTVSGNSMNRLFADGTLLYVDMNEEVRNGDIAVVFVNGDDATVKRVYFEDGAITLHPESYDPEYKDQTIYRNEPDCPPVRFAGRVVSYTAPSNWRA